MKVTKKINVFFLPFGAIRRCREKILYEIFNDKMLSTYGEFELANPTTPNDGNNTDDRG
ncbi:MAG: hypothetical protein IKY79_04630 [Bacteroidales bacterium]|nr:hypothetical protein [Bacteroidales bacterium]